MALTPKQRKLDKNKNNRIDSSDLAKLRSKKNAKNKTKKRTNKKTN